MNRFVESLDNTDKRPKLGSWAPGNYSNSCLFCGCSFTGDKRAKSCAPCAYEFQAKEDAAEERAKAKCFNAYAKLGKGGLIEMYLRQFKESRRLSLAVERLQKEIKELRDGKQQEAM